MSSFRFRLRTPSLAVVALAASLVLLTQGVLVAHADDLETVPASEAVAVASASSDEEIADAPVEPVVEPVVEPAVEPVAEPAAEPAAELADEPVDAAAGVPVASPVETAAGPGEQSDGAVETTPPAPDAPSDADEAPSVTELVGGNEPVVTKDDYYVIGEGETFSIAAPGVLANDFDPEGDALKIQQGGMTTWSGNTAYFAIGGEFGFTAKPGYTGTEAITYFAEDSHSLASAGTVYVTVVPGVVPPAGGNHAPIALNDTYATPHDQPMGIPSHLGLLANDSDPDGDFLSVKEVSNETTNLGGEVSIDADGTFSYYPPAGVTGLDSYYYMAFDIYGEGATAQLVIAVSQDGNSPSGPNLEPLTAQDEYTTAQGSTLVVDAQHGVLANDADPEGTVLTAMILGPGTTSGGGTAALGSDGSLVFTPEPSLVGTDHFAYLAIDADGLTRFAMVMIEITPAVPAIDPGTDPGTAPGEPAPAGEQLPVGGVPTGPIVPASENTGSVHADGDSLALTGFTAGPLLAAALGVLALGALGIVLATRRRHSRRAE